MATPDQSVSGSDKQRLPPLVTRRRFFRLAAGIGALGVSGIAVASLSTQDSSPVEKVPTPTISSDRPPPLWPRLPLVSRLLPDAPDRGLFAPEEQVYAGYLMIVADLANSVVDDDPKTYGWMSDGWWRTPTDPRDPRIMEHVATLAWFYSHDREWNPYYLDSRLLARLDAALGYYLRLQRPDGAWPYIDQSTGVLAPTGFGTVALAATLLDLREVGALTSRAAQIEQAIRASAAWIVDPARDYWSGPIAWSNQVVAGLVGVARAAAALGDPSVAERLPERIEWLAERGQSPAGYFHEAVGMDFGYSMRVMIPDLADLHDHTFHPAIIDMVERWVEFTGFVMVPEPGTSGFVVYDAVSTRTTAPTHAGSPQDEYDVQALGREFIPDVPSMAVFYETKAEKLATRASWADDTSPVVPRVKGNTSPRLLLHVPFAPYGADSVARRSQMAKMPVVSSERFTVQRRGTRHQQLLFVRRPGYYLAAMSGDRITRRTRSGPGLLWIPEAGCIIASRGDSVDGHWASMTSETDSGLVDLVASFFAGSDSTSATIDPSDVDVHTGVFTARYADARAVTSREITFRDDGFDVRVATAGRGVESIPLLLRADDELAFSNGGPVTLGGTASATSSSSFSISRGRTSIMFDWGGPRDTAWIPTPRAYFGGLRRQQVLRIAHEGDLQMKISVQRR